MISKVKIFYHNNCQKHSIWLLPLTAILIICASCAQLGIPSGGALDTQEPKVIEEKSSPNYQTNFDAKNITIEFDEWIVVQNPLKELIISPPLSYPFKFEAKGKRAIFSFSEHEILSADATYQINFGDAVKDFTAGNVFKNFVFIFSTGDQIDSLSIEGTVVDALDKKPRADILVMLYDQLSDTVVSSIKPFYFTKTDNQGKFALKNLRNDTFRIYALKDENVNYIYDLPNENVGFLDSLIILTDSSSISIDLEVFDEIDAPQLISAKQTKKGLIKALYNRLPDDYEVVNHRGDQINNTKDGDTVLIWHNEMNNDSNLYFIKYLDKQDTILNKKARESMAEEKLTLAKKQVQNISIYKDDSLSFQFNHYLSTLDTNNIMLSDTIKPIGLTRSNLQKNWLILHYDSLSIDNKYELTLYPKSVTDIYGLSLQDTISVDINIKDPKDLGGINISAINVDNGQYAAHLMKSDQVINKTLIASDTSYQLKRLESGNYTILIIEDIVPDNRWTPGDVVLKRQSERTKKIPLEELRAGWDIEFTLDLKKIFDGVKSQ